MRVEAVLAAVLCLEGCGAAARGPVAPGRPPSGGEAESLSASTPPPSAPGQDAAPAMAPRAAAMGFAASPSPAPAQLASSSPVEAGKPARAEMLDIEANISIEVEGVASAAAALRAAAKAVEGIVVEDTVNEQHTGSNARLTIRVPVQRVEKFLDSLDGVGRVRQRQVTARDIGKEYFDSELRLENLQTTMRRYEEILKQAKDVNEILRVEGELSRLRADIEQTKGNLRWLRDRAAMATVHINLTTPRHEVASEEPVRSPEAKLYPGLRLTELTDFRGEQGNTSYLGAGLSATFSRHFALHIDGLRASGAGSPTQKLDVVLLTIGGEMYSDFLGGGRRKFVNPYIGYTLGYARFTGNNDAVIGITAGLELFKSKMFVVDAEARAFGLLFGSDGSHFAVQPVLGASVAF
jgi:hypothetical protein